MMNSNKEAHDIIRELADKAEKDVDITDPSIQTLILKLNDVAQTNINALKKEADQGYYSVKDVAELFDISKQTVYQWINEEKIEYEEDQSPGKLQRKGYRIPRKQFETKEQMDKVDPTFHSRHEKDLEDIPDIGYDQSNVFLPDNEKDSMGRDEIKRNLTKRDNRHGQ